MYKKTVTDNDTNGMNRSFFFFYWEPEVGKTQQYFKSKGNGKDERGAVLCSTKQRQILLSLPPMIPFHHNCCTSAFHWFICITGSYSEANNMVMQTPSSCASKPLSN